MDADDWLSQRGLPLEIPRVAANFVPIIEILLFGYLDDRFSKRHRLANASYQIVIEGTSYRERLSPHRREVLTP